MASLICGSLAFDTIMTFEGRFAEQILPDQLHILNVSFLVPQLRRDFGGCAGNIAYTLKLLGGDPLVMATVGEDAGPYRRRLESLGISRDRLILERDSRNTWENAIFTRQLVSPKPGQRWLLVTSAFHMPRSMGIFRKAGFDVEAYPVDWRMGGREDLFAFTRVGADGLGRTDVAVREWIGLLTYRLLGRTGELRPAPGKD